MSQNFSDMSDTYIPELIELDSYWQKAVEDAIHDTLKGEKRLYNALRNRKKINKKLEELGLKSLYSKMSFSSRCHYNRKSNRISKSRSKGKSLTVTDSCGELSCTESCDEEICTFIGIPDGKPGSFPRMRSRSRSRNMRSKSPPNKKNSNNPERPLLGDGSLEKMKKSQNSFNYEPMGAIEDFGTQISESEEESMEKIDELNEKERSDKEMNKKIKWLHVREKDAFEHSDTEISTNETNKEAISEKGFQKGTTLKDLNYFMKKKFNFSARMPDKKTTPVKANSDVQAIPMALDPQEDLFWENEVKDAIRENAGLERKLCLALAKREIVNQNLQGLRMVDCSSKIQVGESQVKNKKRKSQKLLSPFIKFYLEVYKELCHKCPVKQIGIEAARRWENMPMKDKLCYGAKSSKK